MTNALSCPFPWGKVMVILCLELAKLKQYKFDMTHLRQRPPSLFCFMVMSIIIYFSSFWLISAVLGTLEPKKKRTFYLMKYV